ncbi:hypothetical protein JW979_14350 [bacterium]|nr:hypothetical protein [candidate division CSSED10-310 bacterium]
MKIVFEEFLENACLILPGDPSIHSEQRVIFRRDPLMGNLSVLGEGMAQKAELFFGRTDNQLIKLCADNTRQNCFFCVENVEKVTPQYPSEFIPEGRIKGENSILFPNLFPLAQIHAVITFPEQHSMNLSDFNQARLQDVLNVTREFNLRCTSYYDNIRFLSLNINHLPPAGASLFHPHFQIFGMSEYPTRFKVMFDKSSEFAAKRGVNYWHELVNTERNMKARWIGLSGEWHWITAFSPSGPNEILGIPERHKSITQLTRQDVNDLASGISKILRYFHEQGYSSYNFTLAGSVDSQSSNMPCMVRIITRQNFRPNYRTDDYFLQKFLGIELIIVTPEQLALGIKRVF